MKIHDSTRLSTLIEKINPQIDIDAKASSNSLESFNPEKWFQRQWWSFERLVERAKKRGWTSLETAYDHCPLVFIIIVVISTHEIVRDDVARYPPRVQGRLCIRVRQTCIYSNLPEDYGISAGDRYVFGRLDRLEMETADKWCI